MTGSINVQEPGTYRGYAHRYWGTLEEQIADATQVNFEMHSGTKHVPMELWMWDHDCPHTSPEEDEAHEDVSEGLITDWMARNTPGLTWRHGDLYYKNRKRAEASIPAYAAWSKAQREYDDVHDGGVCLDNPMGSVCLGCSEEGGGDDGYEPSPCVRNLDAKRAQDDFWWNFSPEGIAYNSKEQ